MSETVKASAVRALGFDRNWIYLGGLFLLIFGLVGVYFFLPSSVGSFPVDKLQALETLRTQAEECCQAMVQDNHGALVDRTLPYLISMMGGREKYIARLETFASEMKSSGVYAREVTVNPPELFQVKSGMVYGVVPYKLLLKGPLFLSRTIDGQLIGTSTDRGVNWLFFDCTALKGDRTKIKQVLPDFPDELELPKNEKKG